MNPPKQSRSRALRSADPPTLKARRLGLETRGEAVAFMHRDCHICRSEGFSAHARVRLSNGRNSVIATLFHVTSDLIRPGEVGLSEAAWHALGVAEGVAVSASHPKPLESMSKVRSKIYGEQLDDSALRSILSDVVAGRYSDIQLSSFVTACSARPLANDEITALTRAMVAVGDRLSWNRSPIVDKHCVGGLPGNRTTPIIVAIAAACGLTMPKTSSRAITSPAGTADTMETLAPVDLDLATMRRVVEQEGACIAWGGAVRLSPADDTLIRVERALDLDSEGQLVASVLSKKIAAGSSHVVIDMPVGPTAKVRSSEDAQSLSRHLASVATAFGLKLRTVITDGSQPVGRGIGPALEARDVLAVLRGEKAAPDDLRARSLALAGVLLELGGKTAPGEGEHLAAQILDDGRAWAKFQRICEAQGGMRAPPVSTTRHPVMAARGGVIIAIDNRRLARIAKLAGAPDAKAAGVELHMAVGKHVEAGQPLFTIHAETDGELAYALEYAEHNDEAVMTVEDQ